MKLHAFAAAATLIGAALAVPSAQAAIGSTFAADAEGWSVVDIVWGAGDYLAPGTVTAPIHADGGNPGGHIRAADPSDQSFFFQAPGAFLGDLESYYGGTLTFDQQVSPATPEWRDDPDVVLGGGGVQLLYRGSANPGSDWTSFSVHLTAAEWRVGSLTGVAPTEAEFRGVLAALSVLRIRGEYVTGVIETTGLDNVQLTAVPEPETWGMLLAGLGGLAWQVRRRARPATPPV
jgi:hypothetical protein